MAGKAKAKSATVRRVSMPGGPTTATHTARTRERFLAVLSETCNVTQSCAEANWNRQTAYEHRKADPEFAALWDAAISAATDTLEAEARRRALHGCLEPVVSGGRLVMDPDDPTKPLMVRKFSDSLMLAQLKAYRGERYRERFEHTGANGGAIVLNVSSDDANL